jgi:hypothetical protein
MDPAIVVAVVALLGSLLSAAISIYWQVPSSSMSPAFRRSVVRSLGVLPGDRVSRGWRSNVTATGRRPRSRATLDRAPDDGLVSSVHAHRRTRSLPPIHPRSAATPFRAGPPSGPRVPDAAVGTRQCMSRARSWPA